MNLARATRPAQLAHLRAMLLVAAGSALLACTPPKAPDFRMFEVANLSPSLKVELNHLDDGVIPKSYAASACGGENKSLAMRWANGPSDTKSYAVIVFDADVPGPNAYVHWALVDIPSSTTSLGSGESTALTGGAVQLTQDGGQVAYVGPCPPAGEKHRYYAAVYALSVKSLNLPPVSTAARLREVLAGATLAFGRTSALYAR